MPPERPSAHRPAQVRLVALLVAAALALATLGAWWFARFESGLGRDPGVVYRDRVTLGKLLTRANEAERAGDRAAAISAYRFVAAVGKGGGTALAPYFAAARAGLRRLGAADTLPDLPR